jgi:hypothetical protein
VREQAVTPLNRARHLAAGPPCIASPPSGRVAPCRPLQQPVSPWTSERRGKRIGIGIRIAQTTIRCSEPLPSQISPGPTLLNAYSSNLDPPLSSSPPSVSLSKRANVSPPGSAAHLIRNSCNIREHLLVARPGAGKRAPRLHVCCIRVRHPEVAFQAGPVTEILTSISRSDWKAI